MKLTRASKCSILTLLVSLSVFSVGAASAAESITVKYGFDQHPDNPEAKAIERFAELVKERTNGRVVFQLYGSNILGSSKELIEGLLSGGIDMVGTSDGNLADYTKAIDILGLPYLFGSMDDVHKVWYGDVREDIFGKMEKDLGVKVLMVFANGGGPRMLVHKKASPIKLPTDLEGVKIRTTGAKTEVAVLRAWGAQPTPVAWAEVYTSLQQGVVDGTYNQYVWSYLPRFHEVCKAVTEISGNWVFGLQFISEKTWNKISKEDQETIVKAAVEANKLADALDVEAAQGAKEKMIASGVSVYVPTAAEEAVWRQSARAIWDQFVGADKSITPELLKKVTQVLQ